MARIIDSIFPIAPLPKDKKERNAVIEGYERAIEYPTNANTKLVLGMLLFLWLGTFTVSNAYSTFNLIIVTCISFPALLYFISVTLLVKYKLKHGTASMQSKYLVFLLCSSVLSTSFIDLCLGLINHELYASNNQNNFDYRIYLIIFVIALFIYYIGYLHFRNSFNARMAQTYKVNSYAKGIGVFSGLIGYFIGRKLSIGIIVYLACLCALLISIISASALVTYRQYDNIQRAKKGMTYK